MNSESTYQEQWKDYRRRTSIFWLIFLTYVPGVFVVGVPLTHLVSSDTSVYMLAGLWMLAFVISGNYALAWQCPRCRKTFFRTSWYYNSFARQCVHCKLPKWSLDSPA